MKHRYGWKPDLPGKSRLRVFRPMAGLPIPPDLDMRPQQPPIFDQGQLGSCTGNGIAGELEAQALGQDLPLTTLSRLFIYYNERAMEGTVSSDAGASISDGIQSVSTQGACPESEWPYDITQFATTPPAQCYTDAMKFLDIGGSSVTQDLQSIKEVLASSKGIVFGITVYESFESDAVAQSGIVPMPSKEEQILGGHCVRLVGYTDNGINGIPKQHFIGVNSWGTAWGISGYFAIPYEYVIDQDLASDLWVIEKVS
jgi:C1A family cysteine protease